MQQFYIQSILNRAEQGNNFNILAANRLITIRRSSTGELAKLYPTNVVGATLLPNPFMTDVNGQYKFYAQDGKYKAYNADNQEVAEFILQDPFMTIIENTGVTVGPLDGRYHNHHFCLDNINDITVTIGAPVIDSPIDFQTGLLMFFTQIGDGQVYLEPIPGIELIYPEGSNPVTYSKGATIAIESRNNTQWIVTGNLGY